ncbi:MAG: class I SAM-dependent methyltransferase [SAR324 cluster bacterium]|nr:class I SAM-dependent methyltransferase [SAR324 cluster bacterium]
MNDKSLSSRPAHSIVENDSQKPRPHVPKIILKPGRQESVLRKHPWIFSGALAHEDLPAENGGTVEVVDTHGKWLASAAFSPVSQIRARIWSFDKNEMIGPNFFKCQLQKAFDRRQHLRLSEASNAWRMVNAEADGLPGVVVDRYGDYLSCQFLSAGAELWKPVIVQKLVELYNPAGIYERSDSDVRMKEGLEPVKQVLYGAEPPELLNIHEHGVRYHVTLTQGHKTGFYLDQRENRKQISRICAKANVLNCFSYTGGFAMAAFNGGASHITNIDSSQDALDLLKQNALLNQIPEESLELIHGDVFHVLRKFRDQGRTFDVIILDPPKFIESVRQISQGSRGYKDINLLGFKLLTPGGTLATFSCSGHMSPELFQKIVADSALDAKRDAQILQWLSQATDHMVSLNFPESHYLKGLLCRVD